MKIASAVFVGALLVGAAVAQNQPSLAEQAAAARGNKPANSLDPKVAGQVVGSEYRNDFFGFELKSLPGWELLNRGQMNVDEAIVRDIAGLKLGLDSDSSARVFGMHDGAGSSVILAIQAVPPSANPVTLENRMQQEMRSQLPQVRFLREAVLLGERSHRFDAFRFVYTLRSEPINQSLEFAFQERDAKRYLIALVATAPTQEKLTALLHDLQGRLVWSDTTGAK